MVEAGIRELLREHDCVIVPGLGGFLAKYVPAEVNAVTHQFKPPCRKPTFNVQLQLNDGLLINHIARQKKISYQEAGQMVIDFCEECRSGLEAKKTFDLKGIGRLQLNREGKMVFFPARNPELWDEGFGLGALFSPAILRRDKKARPTPAKEMRMPERITRSRIPVSVKVTVAAAIPLILFLLYGIINPSGLRKIPTNYSGILQMVSIEKGAPEREYREVFNMAPIHWPLSSSIPKSETVQQRKEDLNFPETTGIVREGYHIIAGTFRSAGKAEGFIRDFNKPGYTPVITGMNKYGHFRVSVKSFARKADAILFLERFREEVIADAWLLRI
jgi:nucleoid DNA-binding protein